MRSVKVKNKGIDKITPQERKKRSERWEDIKRETGQPENLSQNKQNHDRAGQVAQWIKVLAATPEGLNFILGTHMVGENCLLTTTLVLTHT